MVRYKHLPIYRVTYELLQRVTGIHGPTKPDSEFLELADGGTIHLAPLRGKKEDELEITKSVPIFLWERFHSNLTKVLLKNSDIYLWGLNRGSLFSK